MQRRKVFLLGVGVQKAGTTWLHDYLHGLPESDFGFAKEYHTFDARFLEAYHTLQAKNLERLERVIRKKQKKGFWPSPALDRQLIDLSRLIMFCEQPQFYADYFDRLWQENPAVQLVGDITPGYSLLEAEHFDTIRKLIESRGFELKVLLVMRDPVERCYSAVRSDWQHKTRKAPRPDLDVIEMLKERYATPGFQGRTRYDRIISTLESEFSAEELYYGFYETLFSLEESKRLLTFLGLPQSRLPDFDRRVNTSRRTTEIPAEVAGEIRDFYREAYDFCMARFGRDFITRIWPYA